MKLAQRDLDRAITHFLETHPRRPTVALVHPSRATVKPRGVSRELLYYRGVMLYADDTLPLRDTAGEILCLLGDCVDPAIKIYKERGGENALE